MQTELDVKTLMAYCYSFAAIVHNKSAEKAKKVWAYQATVVEESGRPGMVEMVGILYEINQTATYMQHNV